MLNFFVTFGQIDTLFKTHDTGTYANSVGIKLRVQVSLFVQRVSSKQKQWRKSETLKKSTMEHHHRNVRYQPVSYHLRSGAMGYGDLQGGVESAIPYLTRVWWGRK